MLGGAQHDTVAAVTHILFTITNPTTSVTSVESQLWLPESKLTLLENTDFHGKGITSRFSTNTIGLRNGNGNGNGNTDPARRDSRNMTIGYSLNLIGSNASKLMNRSIGNIEATYNSDNHPHTLSTSLSGK